MSTLQALTRIPTGRRATALLLLCCGFAAARAAGADPLASDSTEVSRASTSIGVSSGSLEVPRPGIDGPHASIDVPHAVVKYDPASLATDRGAALLFRRLVAAARQVCPDGCEAQPFPTPAIVQCRADALARAVSAIDSPRLSAVYRANGTHG